jgi:heme/copper-type cytochrome/quinol oxidase subunit 2
MRAHTISVRSLAVLLLSAGVAVTSAGAQAKRDFTVEASKCAFSPARIEVVQDDLVHVTFSATDAPHSFVIEAYRIAKRAEPGKPVSFDFSATQAGPFKYYSNLSNDEACGKRMEGELVVKSK